MVLICNQRCSRRKHISTQEGLVVISGAALEAIWVQARITANCLSARAPAEMEKDLRLENERELRRTLRELELHQECQTVSQSRAFRMLCQDPLQSVVLPQEEKVPNADKKRH